MACCLAVGHADFPKCVPNRHTKYFREGQIFLIPSFSRSFRISFHLPFSSSLFLSSVLLFVIILTFPSSSYLYFFSYSFLSFSSSCFLFFSLPVFLSFFLFVFFSVFSVCLFSYSTYFFFRTRGVTPFSI